MCSSICFPLNFSQDYSGLVTIYAACQGESLWCAIYFAPGTAFGLCDLGMVCAELGYVSLAELRTVRGRLGLTVERDRHFQVDKPLSAYAEQAHQAGRIVT